MARITLISADVIGKSMAGPAIRYWELARALSKNHEVVLLTPNQPDNQAEGFKIQQIKSDLKDQLRRSDIVITQHLTHFQALQVKWYGVRVIIDAYDPIPLESLEIFKTRNLNFRQWQNKRILQRFYFLFEIADAIICANQKQRDLWMGLLMGLRRIEPSLYDKDCALRNLIEIVPFGLPETLPKKVGDGPRKLFKLKESDKILLWGGGIWNWFDPLSLIEAIHMLSQKRNDIKLVFMGMKHPNDKVPEMKMGREALQLASRLGILDKHVFFNFGWIPYDLRQNFLMDADIGISTHFEHLETEYANRTRILDYLWAGLPIISTVGDSFAELIKEHYLGICVPYQNKQAIADAIEKIVDHPPNKKAMHTNIKAMRSNFSWDRLVQPLEQMIKTLLIEPPKKGFAKNFGKILKSFYKSRSPSAMATHFYHKLRKS